MIIDCHGHYTTSPPEHEGWRSQQVAAKGNAAQVPPPPKITDDAIRESILGGQIKSSVSAAPISPSSRLERPGWPITTAMRR